VMSHHLAPVRAMIGINEKGESIGFIDFSCLFAELYGDLFDYHYFAGKKSKPLMTIRKYETRGYRMDKKLTPSTFGFHYMSPDNLFRSYSLSLLRVADR